MNKSTVLLSSTLLLIIAGCSDNEDTEKTNLLDNTARYSDQTVDLINSWTGKAVVSFTDRGDDDYKVGYFIKDGTTIGEHSLFTDVSAAISSLDLDIEARGTGFSSIIAHGGSTDLVLTGSIKAWDDSEGDNASDFSGLGSMIVASDNASIVMSNMNINTRGFVRAGLIVDEGANVLVESSNIYALGANPLTDSVEGYMNNANISMMISPPWVLGIQGGVRTANMLGNQPTMSIVDSEVTSGGWGVLSIDGSSNAMMNVIDSDLIILDQENGGMSSGKFDYSENYGSGYASYAIGNATQNFYGTKILGTTYATIFTGGTANFMSSTGNIDLIDAKGGDIKTVSGKTRNSIIHSVWGFMSHGDAVLNVIDNTEINSEESIFLYKNGNVEINFDKAKLNAGNGIILQMIDNDDSIVGASNAVFNTEFKEDAGWPSENGNITSQMASGSATSSDTESTDSTPAAPTDLVAIAPPGLPEGCEPPEGFDPTQIPVPSENTETPADTNEADVATLTPPEGCIPPDGEPPQGGTVVGADGLPLGQGGATSQKIAKVTFKNGTYEGHLYNGTGYYGQPAIPLSVTIDQNATLKGNISLTETRHIDEEGNQNTYFTIDEYYYLGHVSNRNYRNGDSTISVTMNNGGTWEVVDESLLSSLTINNGSTIVGSDNKTASMTVNGILTDIAEGTYEGNIVISVQ